MQGGCNTFVLKISNSQPNYNNKSNEASICPS